MSRKKRLLVGNSSEGVCSLALLTRYFLRFLPTIPKHLSSSSIEEAFLFVEGVRYLTYYTVFFESNISTTPNPSSSSIEEACLFVEGVCYLA